jgi:hypothetical protein
MILEGFFLMEGKHAIHVQNLQDHLADLPMLELCRKSGGRGIRRGPELAGARSADAAPR